MLVPLPPELVAAAAPEASAEPVAEPPWPEAVEDEEVFVEVVELLVDVVVGLEPPEVEELLELEDELLEEELEDELEITEEFSAKTASGEAVATNTKMNTEASDFESADILLFVIKIIVFIRHKNSMNALKLPCRALRYKLFCGEKHRLNIFDL